MTIEQAIDRADYICENAYPDDVKIGWLSHLDGMIEQNILDGTGEPFTGYTPDTDKRTELLVPHPFDELYVQWLLCKIYLANQEIEQYNNAATVYGQTYQQYARWYRRNAGASKIKFTNYRE